jgi:hypothetical protein
MAIVSGRRLGPYEILSAIVADEMGDVYKGHDIRLDRIVPISPIDRYITKKFRNGEY